MLIGALLIVTIKIFQQSLRLLPEKGQSFIGKSFGRLCFIVLRNRRGVAIANIKRVFHNKSAAEATSIARSHFEKLGVLAIEFLLVPFLDDTELHKRFTLEGRSFFDEALVRGNGVIGLGFHFGNWEVSGVVARLLKHDIIALARPLKKNVLLNEFLNNLRKSTGLTIIVNRNIAKTVMKLLKENKIVAMLADQREKRSLGVWVDFFGTKVPTSKGVAMIAMKTGSPVIPAYPVRKGFLRYTFVCGPPIEMERKGNIDDLVVINTRKINAFLESIILEYPDEWFWVHRRWGRKEKKS